MTAHRARCSVCLLLLAIPASARASKLPKDFDGYVTAVANPAEFDIGARHVVLGKDVQPTLGLAETDTMRPGPIDLSIRVGTHLHLEGKFAKGGGIFTANVVKVLPDSAFLDKIKIEGAGLIQETPQLRQGSQGWSGTIWIDGYPLQLTPQTKLTTEDGQPFPADKASPGYWVEFRGERTGDRRLQAASMKFEQLQISAKEQKFRKDSEPKIDPPDYAKHTPGGIKWTMSWKLEILPDQAVQDYVAAVGARLIPQYQKDLPAADPNKIDFRFYVVRPPAKWKQQLWEGAMKDAISSPGGLIVVPDNVLAALDNEAQLAALLSNCIAGVLERQAYEHHGRIATQNALSWTGLAGLYGAPVAIGSDIAASNLNLQRNEEASRIGLRYMLHNGYDLREAPFAWTAAANKKISNPAEEVGATPGPLVRSVMSDLQLDYGDVEYTKLTTNREPYQQMLAKLKAADPALPAPKNHS